MIKITRKEFLDQFTQIYKDLGENLKLIKHSGKGKNKTYFADGVKVFKVVNSYPEPTYFKYE